MQLNDHKTALLNRPWRNSFFRYWLPDWARAMFFRNWDVILCRRPTGGPSFRFYHRNLGWNSIRDMCWIRTSIFLRALCSFPAKLVGYICPTRKTVSPMFCQLRTSTSQGETTYYQIADFSPSRLRTTIFRDAIDFYRYL